MVVVVVLVVVVANFRFPSVRCAYWWILMTVRWRRWRLCAQRWRLVEDRVDMVLMDFVMVCNEDMQLAPVYVYYFYK